MTHHVFMFLELSPELIRLHKFGTNSESRVMRAQGDVGAYSFASA